MNDYLYGDRLLGRRGEAPAKHTWWPRHSSLMTRYLILSRADREEEARSARDLMTVTAAEWDRTVKGADQRQKSGRGCMADHAALERELVDASARKDSVSAARAMKAIDRNAVDQSLIYGLTYRGFPEMTFVKLMKEHLEIFFDSVQAYAGGKLRAFDASEYRRKANTLALVELTAEWF